jgi:RNA polymerase sigma-70 factor (ECF subfamily)
VDSHFNQFKMGGEKAFRYYFELYARPLSAYAFFYCKDHMEAQDIVQECFASLFISREKIVTEEHLRGFLFTVARHRGLDRQKMKTRSRLRERDWAEDQAASYQQGDELEQMKVIVLNKIYEFYQRMPSRRKDIFRLYFYQELDVRAIARLRGLKESTVYNHLQHAYSYLIKEIPDPGLLSLVIFFLIKREK